MSASAAPQGSRRAELTHISHHAGVVLVGQLAVMAFGVTDTVVAGRYSETALAALSVGTAVYISVYVGLMGIVQALLVKLGIATQGELLLGLAAIVDQPQLGVGLADHTGLAHLGMVETNELRLLGAETEGELLAVAQGCTQGLQQLLELLLGCGAHQASPPNTSIWLNTQAGDAWPTRTT